MRRAMVLLTIVLCAVEGARAQDTASNATQFIANSASISADSAGLETQPPLLNENAAPPAMSASQFSFHGPTSLARFSAPSAIAISADPVADPAPAAPDPKFVYGGRDDFRWQLALGISLVRFRSSVFYATGVGTDTSITYFTNEWLGFEGRFTTAFAPTIYLSEHVKYAGYGGGPKIAWREQKLEPFVHVLAGGVHIRPQTALPSNALEIQAGGGAGYRFNPRLSMRVVVDYVRSHLFNSWQNNAQATLQAVIHF